MAAKRQYWLVKSEPFKYSWDDLVRDGSTFWDGVRNYQARNHLKAMKKGDPIFYYHSNKGLEIIGIAEVIKEAYQDPTTEDERWVAVDIKAVRPLDKPVALEQIKQDDRLQSMALIRQSRLSVMPVEAEEFDAILELGSAA